MQTSNRTNATDDETISTTQQSQPLFSEVRSDPWTALKTIIDGPLHPGGTEATEALLDRADVGWGTRVLDVGCGAGESLSLARERGASAIGLDWSPREGQWVIKGEMTQLPLADNSVEVVLAECVLCLGDLREGLAEIKRVLSPGGRVAISDVVVEDDHPSLPAPIEQLLCLDGNRRREYLLDSLRETGFAVGEVDDHHNDLLAMRDQIRQRVNVDVVQESLDGVDTLTTGIGKLDTAIQNGRVGYVSVVGTSE